MNCGPRNHFLFPPFGSWALTYSSRISFPSLRARARRREEETSTSNRPHHHHWLDLSRWKGGGGAVGKLSTDGREDLLIIECFPGRLVVQELLFLRSTACQKELIIWRLTWEKFLRSTSSWWTFLCLLEVISDEVEKCPWKIECFLEDLFLGSQWSIILGYIWLSVKFFLENDWLTASTFIEAFP